MISVILVGSNLFCLEALSGVVGLFHLCLKNSKNNTKNMIFDLSSKMNWINNILSSRDEDCSVFRYNERIWKVSQLEKCAL